jgi:CBS domain-containing protein
MTTAYAQHAHGAGSLGSVSVSEAMHRGVVTCRPEATLRTVARVMAAHRIHAVVVAPGGDGLGWGLVSDLDLAAAAMEGSTGEVTAGEIASTPGVFVRPADTMARAAQLMRDYETHHLVVLDRGADRPVGVVSTLDVADVIAELPAAAAGGEVSRPAYDSDRWRRDIRIGSAPCSRRASRSAPSCRSTRCSNGSSMPPRL